MIVYILIQRGEILSGSHQVVHGNAFPGEEIIAVGQEMDKGADIGGRDFGHKGFKHHCLFFRNLKLPAHGIKLVLVVGDTGDRPQHDFLPLREQKIAIVIGQVGLVTYHLLFPSADGIQILLCRRVQGSLFRKGINHFTSVVEPDRVSGRVVEKPAK